MTYSDIHFGLRELQDISEAAASTNHVSGYTHTFYRYPARFSPQFARAVISSLSQPGDLVFDPFMGGGTSLVEALALGRRAIGTDISSLATFISHTKTTLLSKNDRNLLDSWIDNLPSKINLQKKRSITPSDYQLKYQKNLDNPEASRIKRGIEQSLESLEELKNHRQEHFARCLILKTSQWALDGRKEIPSIKHFRETLSKHYFEMILGELDLNTAAKSNTEHTIFSARKTIKCLNRSVIGIENDSLLSSEAPKLIVTSPPYPGIHVLYHRWQIKGRREAPAPFWIANTLDGAGASYYTLGNRHEKELKNYYSQIEDAFKSLSAISNSDTIFVQMLSFAQPEWQLPKYLQAMNNAGLVEIHPNDIDDNLAQRIWRDVPQRKWHANFIGKTQGSKEVILFHKIK